MSPESFRHVLDEEKEIIRQRRENAGLNGPPDGAPAGLALSGGGIRSAAFNLGLLQAFRDHELLPQFDYLSTVSGGSYVGAYLPHLERPVGGNAPNPPDPHGTRHDSRQAEDIHRLVLGGLYLKRPFRLLNHWLLGIVANVAIVMCAVLCLVSFLAWAYRKLDGVDAMVYLSSLGFDSDVKRAFAPCLVFFLLWLFVRGSLRVWNLTTGRRRPIPGEVILAVLAFGMVATALMAVAALLNTGDISLGGLDWWNFKESVNEVAGHVRMMLLFVVLVALLPYLRPQDLIRSGTQPKTPVHSWIFYIASGAALIGIPLLLFGYLARENISDYNEDELRTDRHLLHRAFVNDWKTLLNRITDGTKAAAAEKKQKAVPTGYDPDVALLAAIERVDLQQALQSPGVLTGNSVQALLSCTDDVRRYNRDTWFWERWASWAWPTSASWREHQDDRTKEWTDQEKIVDRINNGCLKQPSFHEAFDFIASPGNTPGLPADWTEARRRELLDLKTKAAALAAELAANDNPDARARLEQLNAQMFRLYYRDVLRDPSRIFALVVQPADQERRLFLFWVFLVAALVLGLFVSLNRTSMHHFYRDRLADMWLPRSKRGKRLAACYRIGSKAPYPLINATVNLQSAGWILDANKEPLDVYLFSPKFCGSERTRFARTEEFEGGRYRLTDAIAVSGAAVGPTIMRQPMLMVLLFLFNSRTGQWLWNASSIWFRLRFLRALLSPSALGRFLGWMSFKTSSIVSRLLFPSALGQLVGYLVCKPEHRAFHFVSDGGHHENLGIESLLRRRCRLIVASDATCDEDYAFVDLVKLFRRMRLLHGIHFYDLEGGPLHLDELAPAGEQKLARRHFLLARIVYAADDPATGARAGETGYLLYVKPNFFGDEEPELVQYRKENAKFPHDPTLDQFFDPRRFECYRKLGYHIGNAAARYLKSGRPTPAHKAWLAGWTPEAPAPTTDGALPDLPRLGAETWPDYVQWLVNGDEFWRLYVARTIADGGKALDGATRGQLEDALVGALQRPETDESVRRELVLALGKVYTNPHRNLDELERILVDVKEARAVREAAAMAIGHLVIAEPLQAIAVCPPTT